MPAACSPGAGRVRPDAPGCRGRNCRPLSWIGRQPKSIPEYSEQQATDGAASAWPPLTRHASLVRSAARGSKRRHAPTAFRLREARAVLDRAANLFLGYVAFSALDFHLHPALFVLWCFVRDDPIGDQDDFVGKRLQ